jgi:hypothetical protein
MELGVREWRKEEARGEGKIQQVMMSLQYKLVNCIMWGTK